MIGRSEASLRPFAIAATSFGALGVLFGAFGAHALRGTIDDAALTIWHTAVDYQFWHALALLALSLSALPATRLLRGAGMAFVIGIVLFCGSLYALILGAPRIVGVITPFGGIALIIGWMLAGIAVWQGRR